MLFYNWYIAISELLVMNLFVPSPPLAQHEKIKRTATVICMINTSLIFIRIKVKVAEKFIMYTFSFIILTTTIKIQECSPTVQLNLLPAYTNPPC